jgi:hypothetical protein
MFAGKIRITNIPDGSVLRYGGFDPQRNSLCLFVHNECFEDVSVGSMCSEFTAELEEVPVPDVNKQRELLEIKRHVEGLMRDDLRKYLLGR